MQPSQLKRVHTAPWPHCPKRNVFSDGTLL